MPLLRWGEVVTSLKKRGTLMAPGTGPGSWRERTVRQMPSGEWEWVEGPFPEVDLEGEGEGYVTKKADRLYFNPTLNTGGEPWQVNGVPVTVTGEGRPFLTLPEDLAAGVWMQVQVTVEGDVVLAGPDADPERTVAFASTRAVIWLGL